MLKQKLHKLFKLKRSSGALVLSLVVGGSLIFGGVALADKFDEKIRQLEIHNATNQDKADRFAEQASSYQDAVNRLQRQINRLQETIDKAERQETKVRGQIKKAQADIDHNRAVLGQSIRTMYEEGDVSTLEILASSTDLSDFVNKQEYRNAVQNKVQDTYQKITELKADLEQKQRRLEQLIKSTRQQQDDRSQAQNRQQRLLDYSADQKASFERSITNNNAKIAELRAAQAAANASHFGGATVPGDPNHGGYPAKWDNLPMDYVLDDWGMYNRECVSYTAWKVFQTYGYMPYWGGRGNANQWPSSAQADGIQTGSTPRKHSVAIWSGGYYGHAMWVEDVYGNGTVRVSQYNYDYQGHYSEMTIPSGGMTYVYFQ